VAAPLDWEYSYRYTGRNVDAYVLDTGIFKTHEDFQGRASCGKSFYNDDCTDIQGHGTHVAGTIGGALYGIAKKAKLISVKVLDDQGSGAYATIIAGIDWVINRKKQLPKRPMIINMSLGGPKSQHVNKAVTSAFNAGIVTVVAAGNEGTDSCIKSPASAGHAITVGATSIDDTMSDFSNYGKCVDVLAPGDNIESTYSYWGLFGTTAILSGTSMAAPHVAGVAALYLHKHPRLRPSDVWSAIKRNAEKGVIEFPTRYDNNFNPVVDLTPNLFLTSSNLIM
jgi:subtilisin family serine protease